MVEDIDFMILRAPDSSGGSELCLPRGSMAEGESQLQGTKPLCTSIKSKKNPHLRCTSAAVGTGSWCSRHRRSQIAWESKVPRIPPFTKRQKTAGARINVWWRLHGRLRARRAHGPALFSLDIAQNPKDVYSFDPISTIPFVYHFSYADTQKLVWVFDLRFLSQIMTYGQELRNPFTQELFPARLSQRLQARAEALRGRGIPIVYLDKDILTPEQSWNQKVLDVFLKLHAHGYGANILWFESLGVRGHELFYTSLFRLWTISLGLTEADRERIVPGHNSGRSPLFRWDPVTIIGRYQEIKWWRKQTLGLMNAFLTRAREKEVRGCGALYILTALAQTHPGAAEVFPWLVGA